MSLALTSVLKADQTSFLKFPITPLSSSLCAPLGPPLLSAAPGLQVGAGSHHLPLDLHLRGKLEHGTDGGSKAKKGRRSRTVFTELQLMGLEKRFEKQKYLSTPDRWAYTLVRTDEVKHSLVHRSENRGLFLIQCFFSHFAVICWRIPLICTGVKKCLDSESTWFCIVFRKSWCPLLLLFPTE